MWFNVSKERISLSVFQDFFAASFDNSDGFWGIDPAQRFTHAHDFFYLLWLTQPDEWFSDAWLDRQQTALLQQKNQWSANWSPEKRATEEKKLQKNLDALLSQRDQFAIRRRFRAQWPERLERVTPFTCQWCGRETRVAVYEVTQGRIQRNWAVIQGDSFNDWNALRAPRSPLGNHLCPACAAARFNHQNNHVPSFASALNVVLDPIHHTPHLINLHHTPWWERPWSTAPALWTTITSGKIPTAWSKRHWLWQALPTLSSHAVNFWYAGESAVLPGELLQELQQAVRTHIQAGRYIESAEHRNRARQDYHRWLDDWRDQLPHRLHLAPDHAFTASLCLLPAAKSVYPDKPIAAVP